MVLMERKQETKTDENVLEKKNIIFALSSKLCNTINFEFWQ